MGFAGCGWHRLSLQPDHATACEIKFRGQGWVKTKRNKRTNTSRMPVLTGPAQSNTVLPDDNDHL